MEISTMTKTTEKIQELEKQIKTIEEQKSKREKRITALQEDVVKKQQRLENFDEDLAKYKVVIEERNLDLESQFAKKVVQRDARIIAVKEKIQALQKELDELSDVDEWKSNLRKKFQEKIDSNNEKVENFGNRKTRTENSLKKYEAKITNLLELNQKNETEISDLQNQIKELEKPKEAPKKKPSPKAKTNPKAAPKTEKK
jgi:chromosome segregation ATPase